MGHRIQSSVTKRAGRYGQHTSGKTLMGILITMAAICSAGVAFYAWFLVGVCKECRRKAICELVCLDENELYFAEARQSNIHDLRAA